MSQGPDGFWNEFNKPFLDDAIQRGDPISIATVPSQAVLVNKATGDLTGFGREMEYLAQNGYTYDQATSQMVKPQ